MMGVLLVLALGQTGGGIFPVQRVTLEQPDGGIVMIAPKPDGGMVGYFIDDFKAMELADERQRKDFELAEARKPAPISTLAAIVGTIKLVLDAVPVVLGVWTAAKQP